MDASFTFDPSSGVAQAVNQTISTGASFAADYSVTTIGGTAFNLDGYSGAASLTKSVSIGSSLHALRTFAVGINTLTGVINLGMGATATKGLKDGRYKFDPIELSYRVPANRYNNGSNAKIDFESGMSLYDKRGEIRNVYKSIPDSVELLFNHLNSNLKTYLLKNKSEKADKDDW